MKNTCHIMICGDICITPDNESIFMTGDVNGLFKNLSNYFEQADLLVGNLEFPLTDVGKGIEKCGPILTGKKRSISVLKNAGFDVLGLANNHIRDCGDEGVYSTLECCSNESILTVGAGRNTAEAKKPVVVNVKDWRIGVMAFAEHEFNAVSEEQAGANLLDLYYSFDEIKEFRNQCDFLIILYHGGIEHYAYPSPLLQKKCRKMVESGADIVLCQHSHCVGTVESFKGGTILYGQGNTVFGYNPNSSDWNEGLVVKITLDDNTNPKTSVEYIPILAGTVGVDLMPCDKAKTFLEIFYERSKKVSDSEFIKNSWLCFCESRKAHYLPLLLGLGRVINYVNRKLSNRIVEFLFSMKRMQIIMNLIRCEAHVEVLTTILEEYDKDNK
ncbi:MAG: CapA family protein [Candidatus Brocadiaceae bacterium]|nr:CapA family protein [Candidatus Brocadiaceae bacterium]